MSDVGLAVQRAQDKTEDMKYEIDKKHLDAVNNIDNNIVKILNSKDEEAVTTGFKTEYKKLIDYVRKNGKNIPPEIIKPSDLSYLLLIPLLKKRARFLRTKG